MKKSKKLVAGLSLTIGIGAGAVMFTPSAMHATSNVVLASVDWVKTQIDPINTKVSSLDAKITSLQATITEQQKEIDSLKAGSGTTTPTTPTVVYVNKSSVRIYSGASTSYKVIATKYSGNSLSVIDTFKASTGLWYRVSISSTIKGWVYSGDVSTTKASSATSATTVVTLGEVNLRKGASTGYAIIDLIPKGTTLQYIQSFTNSLGESWYNVKTSSGISGWMISTLGEVK